MGTFWLNRRVLVTGGSGFIGSHVVEHLVAAGAHVTVTRHPSPNFDAGRFLSDRHVQRFGSATPWHPRRDCSGSPTSSVLEDGNLDAVRSVITQCQVDLCDLEAATAALRDQEIVLHLAARVAGVAYNQAHPAEMFRENVQMTLNVLEAARLNQVERVEVVSSACVYPRDCRIPTPESEGFRDDPEPSNLGYGWAKRIAEVQARLYALEYDMAIGIVRPYNAYGPRDHFDPEISHVIPALIHQVMQGEDPLLVWGSGEQTRAFLYVDDFARGVLEAAERYPQPDPVNLGTTEEIAIKDLVARILEACGRRPRVVFDASQPSGQPRRNCDTTKAERLIGFRARVPLAEGLRRTVAWYRTHPVRHGMSNGAHQPAGAAHA